MNFKNIFLDVIPSEKVVADTAERLLQPLRSFLPSAVNTVLQTLDNGRYPVPAGERLADAIRAWGEKIRAEERETQKKLEARIQTQEQQLAQQAKDIQAAKRALDDANKALAEMQETCIQNQKMIDRQNDLIVKQHEQLALLSGLPKDQSPQ